MKEEKSNQPDNITVSGVIECEFTVRIEYKRVVNPTSPIHIKDELSKKIIISEKHLKNEINEIPDNYFVRLNFVQKALQKQFKFLGNKKTYFTDYREEEGSLLINFTVVIIGAFMEYGSIRESMDHFVEDIQTLYNNVLLDDYAVSTGKNIKTIYTTPQIQSNQEINTGNIQNIEFETTKGETKTRNGKNLISIGLSILILLILIGEKLIGTNQDKAELDKQIEQKIESKIRESKVDELIKNTEGIRIGDTLIIKKLYK